MSNSPEKTTYEDGRKKTFQLQNCLYIRYAKPVSPPQLFPDTHVIRLTSPAAAGVCEDRTALAKLRVTNQTKGRVLADRADMATTSVKRRTGLLKHTGLEPGEGLWIAPCESIHTFAMKFPIDVIFLNKKKQILKTRQNMVKSRIAFSLRAYSVLELPAGTLAETGTVAGDQLEFEKYDV
jgi:hypothetical protein